MNQQSDKPTDRIPPRFAAGPGGIESHAHTFRALDYHHSEFSWEQAVRILRKNGGFGLAISLLLIAGVSAAVILMKDVYQPIARVEIAPPTSGIRTLHEVEAVPEVEDADYFETQTQILESDSLAMSVIRQLKLDQNPEFTGQKASHQKETTTPYPATGPSENDKVLLGEQMSLATLTPSESAALKEFREDLSINPVRNTRLVEVSFASSNPQIARDVTNEVIAKFIENDYKRRYNATTQASDWLSSQLNDLYQKVVASTQALSDYQRKHGLVETDDREAPSTQLMSEINRQLSDAQATRIENQAYLQMIDSGQGQFVPSVREDKVYQDLMLRQGDLRTQLAQARAVYGEANTNVKKLNDQLNEVWNEIDEEQKRLAHDIQTAYSAAKDREELLLQSRDKLQAQMVNVNSEMVEYHLLKSEAIANSDLYNTLQARLKEAGIYAGLGSNNIRVVDLAENLREPTGPHRAALIAIGIVVSALIGLLACFFKESMNNTVRTPEDVRSWVGLKSLALLPVMIGHEKKTKSLFWPAVRRPQLNGESAHRSNRMPISMMRPLSAESEAVRDLRTVLLASKEKNAANVILISSSMEGEGKTTVAVNFAAALAQIGRTCLVDADLRRPATSGAFNLTARPGLAEVLIAKIPLANVLTPVSEIPNLWVLPCGQPVACPADVLASPGMKDAAAALRKQFQFVVIDSPPIIRFSDARHLSRLADEVVLIGRYGITTKRAIQRSTELLHDVQAPLAGVVLNGIDYSSPDYHYFTYGYCSAAARQNGTSAASFSETAQSGNEDAGAKSKGAHA